MSSRIRVFALASVALIISGIGVMSMVPAQGATARPNTKVTFTVSDDHVVCNTLTGTIAFATKLSFAGSTTGAETATIKGTVNGCTDTDNANVGLFSGTLTGTVNTTGGTNCLALFGTQAATSSTSTLQIVWKPASGQAFSPVDPTTLKPTSKVHLHGFVGTFFTVQDDNNTTEGTWTGVQYGGFQFGAQYDAGATMSGGTELFTGGEAGASGSLDTAAQFDIQTSATLCTGAGIAKEAFGIGQVTLG